MPRTRLAYPSNYAEKDPKTLPHSGNRLSQADLREPTSGLQPLTPAPTTSLLAQVLACTGASGNSAYQWGFRHLRRGCVSIA